MQDLVRFGVDIGARVEVVGSPLQRYPLEGVSYEQCWTWFSEAMAACGSVDSNFTVCIEPLAPDTQNSFLFTAAEGLKMAREIGMPNVRVILDCYSGVRTEVDFPNSIRAVGKEFLGHFHLNDHNERAPGYGDTDFVAIMKALLDIDYEGYASIEVFDYSLDPVEHAAAGLKTVQEALAQAQAQ
jgi:sugar phosphate isomerase/epimerase